MTTYLNVAARIPCTSVEGPGLRYALWVQGCDIDCPGCCNQELLPFVRRQVISSSEIILEIEQAREFHDIEGVTFLGGEPAYQAKGLAEIAALCQLQGLSVMMFTGFQLGQLRQRNLPGVEHLLSHTDIVVDGPFVVARRDTRRNWVGSENQRFHYLTQRYDALIETSTNGRHAVEVRIGLNDRLEINGFPLIDELQSTSQLNGF
ncbi:4Fe-4S single cluster domain-containing protein [Accumulibacter sp.]|uniref:4Fe-4S single cluster domain-containing protein n=1 Tax=Accumulibacter sp. TaxID=2053492 RepID=UPI00263295F4|nr:4Fe-4S single cluster domain-containing protein [Accumulibacter sp.]